MKRLVWLIELAFIILVLSIIYRRYIRPFYRAMRGFKEAVGQAKRNPMPAGQEARTSRFEAGREKPISDRDKRIDRSQIQDAEFEDLT